MLKVGIIGSGFGVIGLLPAFASVRGCQVTAVCAKHSEQLDAQRRRFGLKNIYSDWRSLLEKADIDAVAVAVTPNAQYEIAKVAIAKGIHVFAEKPLSANLTQAQELVTLAAKKKITHGVDFIFPEIAQWKKVKELLERETFGKLQHISASWDWLSRDVKEHRSSWKTNTAEGGGVLSFYFSHGLHYLEYFAGAISGAQCLFTHSSESINGGEVGADMLLKFRNGITGHAHVSCISRGYVAHQLIFQCTDGVVVLANENAIVDGFTVRTYSRKGFRQLKIKNDKGLKNEDERVKIVRKLAARFVKACTDNKQMHPSFREGLRVQKVLEQMRSAKIA